VFSLGSVLAFAATGRSPFGDHQPLPLMMRISGHEPDLAGVPEALRGPISACLAKRPEGRPTAAELGGMLGTVVADGPGRLPTEVAALGAVPEAFPPPPAPTRVATDGVDVAEAVQVARAPVEPQGISRRAMFGVLGAIGLVGAGGWALSAAAAPSEPRWTATSPLADGIAAAATDDTTLYVYGEDSGGAAAALDSSTGAERWRVPGWSSTDGTSSYVSMALAGGILVIGTGTTVAALDAATGRRRWEMPRSSFVLLRPSVSVADGIVVATGADGLVGLDVETGVQAWRSDLGDSGDIAEAVAANGTCFVMHGVQVDARNLWTGKHLWTYESPLYPVSLHAVAGGVVVAVHSDSVVGLDAGTGHVRWDVPGPGSSGAMWHSLDPNGRLVVGYRTVGAGAELFVVDPADGGEEWSHSETDWTIATRPLVADGLAYISINGVRAFDVESGAQRWSIDDRDSTYYEPIAGRGRDVYFWHRSSQNEIHAFTIA
jgi:outer membrane protein assembly factor BamB